MTTLTDDPPPALRDAAPTPASVPVRTVITPPGRWEWVDVGELWRYRELLATLALRDVRVRYKQTVLGVAWAVLQPALMMAIFTVVFGRFAGVSTGGVPGPLFFLTGLLPWTFFSGAFTAAAGSVTASEGLITKIFFPRLLVPLSTVVAATVDHLIACGLLVVLMGIYQVEPTWNLLLLPLVSGVVALAAAAAGVLFAALQVRYRDVRYVVPFGVQILMYATPTIFLQPRGDEGGVLGWLLLLNPLSTLVSAWRACVVGGPIPWLGLAVCALLAVGLLVVACLYFRRTEDVFADII